VLLLAATVLLAGCSAATASKAGAVEPLPGATSVPATATATALPSVTAVAAASPSPSPTKTAAAALTATGTPAPPIPAPPAPTPTEAEAAPVEVAVPPTETPFVPEPTPTAAPTPTARVVRPTPTPALGWTGFVSPYTGAPVADAAARDRRAIVVQIDNAPPARPQSGLSCADLVYETPTEAGWTRFSAFFQSHPCDVLGPIRSARLINIQLGQEYPTVVMSAGAADEVLEMLDGRNGFKAVNLLRNGSPTFRSRDRPAPHNLYATLDGLRGLAGTLGLDIPVRFGGLSFGELSALPGAAGLPAATAISIPYGASSSVRYRYDPASDLYFRWVNGSAHYDALTGDQLAVRTVVVQWADFRQTDIVEDVLGSRSLDVTLIGSGRVVVYRDGKRIVGRWQRNAPGDVTRYYDAAGREIPLGPGGPTWVELVPQNLAVDDDGP
jgi:hypothetical protein